MELLTYKWIAAIVLLVISILAGFASMQFAARHQKSLQLGDALANGIFLGVALFHLLPHAVEGFEHLDAAAPVMYSLALIAAAFLVLFILEHVLHRYSSSELMSISAWALTITLGLHALVAGIALGISESIAIVSMILFAVLAHKSFELFALVIKLTHLNVRRFYILFIFLVFSWVTPLGIWLGALSDSLFTAPTDNFLMICFNAIAAGTFIYIGGFHQHKHAYHPATECYHEYTQVLMTIAGIITMGLLAIWV